MLCVEGIVVVVAILSAEHRQVLVAYHNRATTLGGIHHAIVLVKHTGILASLVE